MFPTTRSPILAAALVLATTGCFESSSAPGSGDALDDGGGSTMGDGGYFALPEEGGAPRDDGSVILDPGGDTHCEFELEHEGCSASALLWRDYEHHADPGFEPSHDRVVEGLWHGAEPIIGSEGAWLARLEVDEEILDVRVWAELGPLADLLVSGDPVRLAVEDGVLTLHRTTDDALMILVVHSPVEPEGAFSAHVTEGLGASLEAEQPCDTLVAFSSYCDPMPVRGYALRVGATEVPLANTRDVSTDTGVFRVTNVTMYGWSRGYTESAGCESCAIAVEPEVRVHAVRVE